MVDQIAERHAARESELKSGYVKLKDQMERIESLIKRSDSQFHAKKLAVKVKKLSKHLEGLDALLSPLDGKSQTGWLLLQLVLHTLDK